jgi:UDP-N-acetylglucosamine 2-epimerase (non-hydrolysing)
VVVSTHPRTWSRLEALKRFLPVTEVLESTHITFSSPFKFFDFSKLERNAALIVTDSGTVQEEACIMRRPCIVIRDTTERPETVACGATVVTGASVDRMQHGADAILEKHHEWEIPPEYLVQCSSQIVLNTILSNCE